MKYVQYMLVGVLLVLVAISVCGCSKKQSVDSREAIERSESFASSEARADYLVKQARDFIVRQDYEQAKDIATFILNNLDDQSEKAEQILADVKKEMLGDVSALAEEGKRAVNAGGL